MNLSTAIPLVLLLGAAPLQAQHDHASHTIIPDAVLQAQLEEVRAATACYQDHARAEKDGYRLFGAEGPLMGEHWYHPDLTHGPLNLKRPSTLQYATIDGRRVLVGVAYTLYQRPREPLPEGFSGRDDQWHTHDVVELARELTRGRPVLRWITKRRAERGRIGAGDGRSRLTMVHAWIWSDNPGGVFAAEHRALPWLRAGLPSAAAAGASRETAMGVSLLLPSGCEGRARADRLMRPDRSQRRALAAACQRTATHVRAARAAQPGELNRIAAESWQALAAERARVLRPEQLAWASALEATAMHARGH